MSTWAVVLAGGVGSRFWPLSTPQRPKQLLPLATNRPLLTDTLDRLAPLTPPERTLVLTNAELAEAIAEVAAEIPAANVIAEPRPAGTAAALAWAASRIAQRAGRDAIMVCVHADWAIRDADEFRQTIRHAIGAAERHHALVTVGVVPSRAEVGYGYIEPGEQLHDGGAPVYRVARFIEKPDRERAAALCADGCLWNSGIFVWRVGDLLDELRTHTPEVASALGAAGDDANAFFAAVKPISIDVGLLERTARVLVVPGTFGWDDVGTWAALSRVRPLDEARNALSGDVHLLQSEGNVVHAEDSAVVLYGVQDLVVVARPGLTLVTTTEHAAELKTLVESLPATLRELR